MNINFFENLVEQKLLSLHTTYIAKVLSVNNDTAKIQPLSLVKSVGGTAKKQAVVDNVPISKGLLGMIDANALKGETVLVICCERDISRTRKGEFALPSIRRHSMSDSIIIDCLTDAAFSPAGVVEIPISYINSKFDAMFGE